MSQSIKYICDNCGFEQDLPVGTMISELDVPPRWGVLTVEQGSSSASLSQRLELCPSCVNQLLQTAKETARKAVTA